MPYIHNHVLHFIVQQNLTAEIIQHYPAIILQFKKKILRETKKDIEKVKEVMYEENETRQISNEQPKFTTKGTRKRAN